MSKTTPVTHLVIVNYINSYEGPTIMECHGEAEAVAKFESALDCHADVRLVDIKRESPYISRRVAGSVDQ